MVPRKEGDLRAAGIGPAVGLGLHPNTLADWALPHNEVELVPPINDARFQEEPNQFSKAETLPGHMTSGVTGVS